MLKRYLAALRSSCALVTLASTVDWLAMTIRVLAPERDWSWLGAVHRRLQRRAEPSRNKRARVVPAADLYAFGLELMRQGQCKGGQEKNGLLAFRDGLMIASLVSRPLRASNFMAIEIGRQLSRVGAGWALCFPAAETKNARPLEFPYPAELGEALEHYLRVVRPGLIAFGRERSPRGRGRGCDAGQHLWVSLNGTRLHKASLTHVLRKRTPARFGHLIGPHLFRDCAATSTMEEAPQHVHIAARLLGHATLATTERHYILASTRQALSRHQKEVLALRKRARRR